MSRIQKYPRMIPKTSVEEEEDEEEILAKKSGDVNLAILKELKR